MTQVAILWHMHQPFYEDLVTHEHILPWVRLHALKDYYGMVALLDEFPNVRVTFNLVPSLLVQLQEFAENRAKDRFLDLSLKPAADLTSTDTAFMIRNFFHAQRQRMIDPYQRYRELLAQRGSDAGAPPPRGFSAEDLRDLQVWHKLVWIDPDYLERDERVRRLVNKGRGFTEDDKGLLRDVELELLNKVIPAYRAAAARGQVELSTSPFYHPILPLLSDSDVYLRIHPGSRMPRQRFVHPEDAGEQLVRAAAYHERLFGLRPVGLWPSEGAVSDVVVPIAAQAGFTWLATDELILARTLNVSFSRDANGHLEQPERLYTPYRIAVGPASLACAFRDHGLSDRIGFIYSGWTADAAADDLVSRLVEGGRRFAARTGGEEAVIPIILDGENAWEHFEGGGRPFLRALYRRLSSHPDLRTVTMAEACRKAQRQLAGIFPGSWIDADFYIWIGHADDQRAWSQLAEARRALEVEASPDADPTSRARAREEVLVAEGSDWFWWYGDDHSSSHDEEFDDLFRRHLRNVYKLLDRPTPEELFLSNISVGVAPAQAGPVGLLEPTLDGEQTSYFEWVGAGVVELREAGGTMHEADWKPPMLTLVQFGFDATHLFVRLDARLPLANLLAEGYEFSLKFVQPRGMRLSMRQTQGRPNGVWWDRPINGDWAERRGGRATVAAGTILEVGVALVELGLTAGDPLAFVVAAYDGAGREIERHPRGRAIEATVPDGRFTARHWNV